MHYFCISFTHKNTSIDIREQISLSDELRKFQIQKLILSNSDILECMVISTCNRVEVLCYIKAFDGIYEYIINCFCIITKLKAETLQNKPDIYEDIGCIHHIFSVASSLDSLVIGETQITSQIKESLKYSLKYKYAGANILKLIQASLKCGAQIRNQTSISKNPVSISSVAVAKAKELDKFDIAVVIGAGVMGELACKHLIASGIKVLILSKTKEKSDDLAKKLGYMASSAPIERLKDIINSHSLIFSATSSSSVIINDNMIEARNFKRYFFDIAIPRDIDIEKSMMIEVFSIDDLKDIVNKNISLREEEANKAYKLINEHIKEFYKNLASSHSLPLVKKIYLNADACLDNEFKKAIKKGYLKNSDIVESYKFANQFKKAFLHQISKKIKNLHPTKDSPNMINSLKYLFDIQIDEKPICLEEIFDDIENL